MASSAKELDGVCVDTVAIARVENYPHDIRRVVAIQDGAGGLIHGCVDLARSHSTDCQALLGQLGIGLNWLVSWANLGNIKINFNPTVYQTTTPALYT